VATYLEILTASEDPSLKKRIRVACFVAAELIRTEADVTPNHVARLAWAKEVFRNPEGEASRMIWAVLAQNKDLTVAAITGATDAQVQTAVNAAVNVFAV
jgi:hypothetical protein